MNDNIVNPEKTFGEYLKFTPYAWGKLLYMRDIGDTEVAGYCITETNDPLLVTDFITIKQTCTGCTFDLDVDDLSEFSEKMLDTGLMPWQFSNILAHTHPGDSPNPSGVDEENFEKAFSHPDWAIMFILAEGGQTYCRIKSNTGPGLEKTLKVSIEWGYEFYGSDHDDWKAEYKNNVSKPKRKSLVDSSPNHCQAMSEFAMWSDGDMMGSESFDDPFSSCYWSENGDVLYWDDDESVWYLYDPDTEKLFSSDDLSADDINLVRRQENTHILSMLEKWSNKYADERYIGA